MMQHSVASRSALKRERTSRGAAAQDPLDAALADLKAHWRRGERPSLSEIWWRHDPEADPVVLAGLIKAELRYRFSRGERPQVADYLAQFAPLRHEKDRVVSLVYEEFCLLEESGESPDPATFCDRYAPWRDSLLSQLKYHRMISLAAVGPDSPPRFPSPGQDYLGCELREILGRGGTANVYLARETKVGNRSVVLKLSSDRGQEQDILGKLEHPHIVPILWATPRDEDSGLRGICMPYRQGVTLDRLIPLIGKPIPGRRRPALSLWQALVRALGSPPNLGPLPPSWRDFPVHGTFADAVAWLGWKLAQALEHAHAVPIIHRDLKPANILLTVRDGPQILDFNLAHDPHSPERAESAMRGGTLPYMASEQLLAFLDDARWADVGSAADQFALGLLLRELLGGEPPESPTPGLPRARAVAEMLDRRARPLPSLDQIDRSIPYALIAILDRCCARHRDNRYPDTASLVEDLERYLDRRPLVGVKNPSLRESLTNRLRRGARRLSAAVLGISMILAVAYVARRPEAAPIREPAVTRQQHLADGQTRLRNILQGLLVEGPEQQPLFPDKATALHVAEEIQVLRDQFPDSQTLPRLHALLLYQADDPTALTALGTSMSNPERANDPLISGLDPLPEVSVLFANQGRLLLSSETIPEADRPRFAAIAYALAADLDPGWFNPWRGMAVLAFQGAEFQDALTYIDRALAVAETSDPKVPALECAELFWTRAAIKNRLANTSITDITSWSAARRREAAFREALASASDGLALLDRAEPVEIRRWETLQISLEFAQAVATSGLAEIAVLRGQLDSAVDLEQQTIETLQRIWKLADRQTELDAETTREHVEEIATRSADRIGSLQKKLRQLSPEQARISGVDRETLEKKATRASEIALRLRRPAGNDPL